METYRNVYLVRLVEQSNILRCGPFTGVVICSLRVTTIAATAVAIDDASGVDELVIVFGYESLLAVTGRRRGDGTCICNIWYESGPNKCRIDRFEIQ